VKQRGVLVNRQGWFFAGKGGCVENKKGKKGGFQSPEGQGNKCGQKGKDSVP